MFFLPLLYEFPFWLVHFNHKPIHRTHDWLEWERDWTLDSCQRKLLPTNLEGKWSSNLSKPFFDMTFKCQLHREVCYCLLDINKVLWYLKKAVYTHLEYLQTTNTQLHVCTAESVTSLYQKQLHFSPTWI